MRRALPPYPIRNRTRLPNANSRALPQPAGIPRRAASPLLPQGPESKAAACGRRRSKQGTGTTDAHRCTPMGQRPPQRRVASCFTVQVFR